MSCREEQNEASVPGAAVSGYLAPTGGTRGYPTGARPEDAAVHRPKHAARDRDASCGYGRSPCCDRGRRCPQPAQQGPRTLSARDAPRPVRSGTARDRRAMSQQWQAMRWYGATRAGPIDETAKGEGARTRSCGGHQHRGSGRTKLAAHLTDHLHGTGKAKGRDHRRDTNIRPW